MGQYIIGKIGYGIPIDDEVGYRDVETEGVEMLECAWQGEYSSNEFLYLLVAGDYIKTDTVGSPTEITIPEIQPEWREQLQAACIELGIPFEEPKWYLCASVS